MLTTDWPKLLNCLSTVALALCALVLILVDVQARLVLTTLAPATLGFQLLEGRFRERKWC